MPKCLKCGCELELDDTYGTEFNGDTVTTYNIGHCPNCDTDHQWEEGYKFEKFQDLEIDQLKVVIFPTFPLFWRAAHVRRGQFFHYTTCRTFCQVVIVHKLFPP